MLAYGIGGRIDIHPMNADELVNRPPLVELSHGIDDIGAQTQFRRYAAGPALDVSLCIAFVNRFFFNGDVAEPARCRVCAEQAGNRRAEQYAILCASLQRDVQDAAGEAADEFGFTPTQTTLIAGCA